eukprot:TRINITY_DN28134_c0_g1_i1.p1 TRINITY_DN28134_c0_g1~~TRINITY_DN28134_c0_g1_i1.p1  ORF type:complete len:320 (+),score=62.84 TRINITY_DN28134_c0_g1_i1:65-1024(+)
MCIRDRYMGNLTTLYSFWADVIRYSTDSHSKTEEGSPQSPAEVTGNVLIDWNRLKPFALLSGFNIGMISVIIACNVRKTLLRLLICWLYALLMINKNDLLSWEYSLKFALPNFFVLSIFLNSFAIQTPSDCEFTVPFHQKLRGFLKSLVIDEGENKTDVLVLDPDFRLLYATKFLKNLIKIITPSSPLKKSVDSKQIAANALLITFLQGLKCRISNLVNTTSQMDGLPTTPIPTAKSSMVGDARTVIDVHEPLSLFSVLKTIKQNFVTKNVKTTEQFKLETHLDHLNCSSSHHEGPMTCLLYTSPSPRDGLLSRMPSSA